MRRRTRTWLWLVASCVLLAVAVVAQLRHERRAALDPLTTIDLSRVRELRVECRGCTPRRFERSAGHWQMREPQDVRADQAAVEHLLAIAAAPVRRRHARGVLDPARIGLEPPQAVLTLDGQSLRFGATEPIDGDRYVDTGSAIALVPDRYSALLFEPAEREIARDAPPPH